jgi:hypothetical protein
MLIESTTFAGDVVMDCIALICLIILIRFSFYSYLKITILSHCLVIILFITISCLCSGFCAAYQKVIWHILALKDGEAIYKSILQPLILEPLTKVFKKQRLNTVDAMVNSEEEAELPIPDIMQKTNYVRKLVHCLIFNIAIAFDHVL